MNREQLAVAADLLKTALQRPVAYHRAFAQIAGKVSAGLMLSQAWYWTPRTNKEDGWFYKTRKEWTEETGMSRTEQETARKRLLKLGLLEEKLASMPAKMHFRVNTERLISLLVENPPTRRRALGKQVGGKPTNMKAENPPAITESTTESKPETAKEPSAHAELMDFLSTRVGHIPNGGQQGKSVKWLLERYDPVECFGCFNFLAAQEWRSTPVTWSTVQSNIGAWLTKRPMGAPNGRASSKLIQQLPKGVFNWGCECGFSVVQNGNGITNCPDCESALAVI